MAGLDPAIHVSNRGRKNVDACDPGCAALVSGRRSSSEDGKPGHDDGRS